MRAAVLKAEIASALGGRCPSPFDFRERPVPETLSTGLPEVDSVCGGLPRGAITEIVGPASSGRTSLLLAILAEATAGRQACALVDTSDTLDPASAAAAGVDLSQLLWIRCAANKQHALKVMDLLLGGGGFGLVVLDLGDIAPRDARRIPAHAWFRLRRAIEDTPTVLVVLGQEPYAQSCAALVLEAKRESAAWVGHLLQGARFQVGRVKSAIRNPQYRGLRPAPGLGGLGWESAIFEAQAAAED